MFERLLTYMSFVRLSHTVFALPFALTGALLAAQTIPLTWGRVVLIIAAMVTARTAAMGFNRLVDTDYDAENLRTANRELPAGLMSRREAIVLVSLASIAFVGVTFLISTLCLVLSPVALAIIFWYSLAKRYTAYTQLYLGLALAVAPVGGWLAAGGRGGLAPWLLALGTAMWVAGFDILYAFEDIDFDRKKGLFSIPARFGIKTSLLLSRAFHVITVMSLLAIALVVPLGPVYIFGVIGVSLLLIYEQSIVHVNDLSRVKQAFNINGYVGILYFLTTVIAIYV